MTATILRQASTLMRERADRATVSPWCTHDSTEVYGPTGTPGVNVLSHDPVADYRVAHVDPWGGIADAEHVASWHPAVALAVADWLDEEFDHQFGPCEQAIAVARAYLGNDQ